MNKSLKEETLRFIEKCGFKELTSVQNECINLTKSHKDLVTIAKTGTGKTHAYLIPIAEMINPVSDKTQVLISLPTRELAYQVYEKALVLKEVYEDLRISFATGGTDKNRSVSKMNKAPHIIIGTPGRIKDLFENNKIRVDFVQMFIIDEADMTLDYGFLEDIDVVFSKMVKNPEVLCYSATFSQELKNFVRKYLNNPKIVEVKDEKRDPQIKHVLVPCKHLDYKDALLNTLKGFNPYICMIFAGSRDEADEVYQYLNEHDYRCLLIHGGLDSRDRQKALKQLYRQEYRYIVASDVASRGIDVEGVSHVVSLGLPKELEFYTHRAGRTGRNGQDGICYLLYKESEIAGIKSLSKQGINFTCKEFKNGSWKACKNPVIKKQIRIASDDKELVQILKRKNEKVKPNYKKKRKQQLEELKRKKRRDFIRSKIKEEKLQRYKDNSKNKAQ